MIIYDRRHKGNFRKMFFIILVLLSAVLILFTVLAVPNIFRLRIISKSPKQLPALSTGLPVKKTLVQIFVIMLTLTLISFLIIQRSGKTAGNNPASGSPAGTGDTSLETTVENPGKDAPPARSTGSVVYKPTARDLSGASAGPGGKNVTPRSGPSNGGQPNHNSPAGNDNAGAMTMNSGYGVFPGKASAPESNPDILKRPKEPEIEPLTPAKMKDLEKSLIPSSFEYHDVTRSTGPVKRARSSIRPYIFAHVSGSRPGDFFVYSYYDTMENGIFIKSVNCQLIPPRGKRNVDQPDRGEPAYVRVALELPPLDRSGSVQVPFLLTGRVDTSSSGENNLTIDALGTVSADENIKKQRFTYVIHRTEDKAILKSYFYELSWLDKEYPDIPYPILKELQKAYDKNDMEKLGIAAGIFSRYFAYKPGLFDISPDERFTWNAFLENKLRTTGKLHCDCDILSTYAFIYLKYLGLKPFLILGFLKTGPDPNILSSDELHATIYVKADNEWMIFEPTLFTDVSSDKVAAKKGPVKTDENPIMADVLIYKNSTMSIRKGITSSGLRYFTLPGYDKISGEYTALAEAQPALKSLRLIRERINLTKLSGFENALKSKQLISLMILFSVYSYVIFTVFIQFLLVFKHRHRSALHLPPLHYLVLSGSIAVYVVSILIRLSAASKVPGFGQSPVESITSVLCFLAAILSLFTLMSFFSPDIPGSNAPNKIAAFLGTRNIFLSALAVNAAAAIFAPSFPVFASTILVIKILYDHLNNDYK
ncbi:MAG: hypothetical protein HQL30_07315 [Candidatus Omnitrophica bacterium]|nr:hypothetical protein [Candidatus Omnitrophota bacterium]